MQKFKKFTVITVVMLTILLCSSVVFAASSDVNDGIKATIITDKEQYSKGDKIKVTVTIENINPEAVKNIRYKVELPKGLEAVEGSVLEKTFLCLEPNQKEVINIDTVANEEITDNDDMGQDETDMGQDETDMRQDETDMRQDEVINTNDNSPIICFIVLAVVAMSIVIIARKGKRIVKNITIFIILLTFSFLNSVYANGETIEKNFTINKIIKYKNCNMEIVVRIFYDYEEDENIVAYGEKNGIIVINAADAINNTSYALSDNNTLKCTGIENVNFAWDITENYKDSSTNTLHQGIQLTPVKDSSNPATSDWHWLTDDDIEDAPSLSYKIYVEKEGDYYLSFHSNNPNDDADSFHVGVNGEYKYNTTNAMSGGSNSEHAAVGTAWFYCDKEAIHLNAGINTITIWARESGICLRQIMLTREKPMESRYLYFQSQKSAEWLETSDIVNGFIKMKDLEDVNIEYGGQLSIDIDAMATNGQTVELSVSSSTKNVKVSKITNNKFEITAQKSGYSTITVMAEADGCTTVVKTFFVNVAYKQIGSESEETAQNLRVVPASETSNSIAILWDKPEIYSDITEYDVYLNGQKVATKASNKTHYTATGLEADTEYEFYVEAVYSDGKRSRTYKLYACTDSQGQIINIAEAPYNAVGDGVTMNTEIIQQAIDDCPENGIVLIPKGKFLTGALDLKSHMTLQVEGELLGSDNPNDYMYPDLIWDDNSMGERVLSRFEGWELMCLRSLLSVGYLNWQNRYEVTCEDLTICGNGKITGGGVKLQDESINMAKNNGWSVGTTNQYLRSRGFLLNITQSKNIYLTGVHFSDSPCWTIHMIYSDTVSTHGVEITSTIINGDGWDPDSSRNLILFDSKISTGDDCVAIKSGKNPEGNNVAIPTENVLIFDLECDGGHGLAVGSEISGGVNNVTVRDVVVKNTLYGFQLKGTAQRGGGITNLYVQDSTFNQLLIKSNVFYNGDGAAALDVPLFNNLTFKNIVVDGTNMSGDSLDELYNNGAIELSGFDKTTCHNHYVNNVLFENVRLGSKTNPLARIVIENCDGISFKNVKQYNGMNPDYLLINKNINIQIEDDTIPEFTDSIEAEEMGNFTDIIGKGYAHKQDSIASGEFYREIRSGDTGILKARYSGEDGFATINVDYLDLIGGSANYKLYVNDTLAGDWIGNQDTGAKRTMTINGIVLKKGDIIKIVGTVSGSDKAAIDKLTVSNIENSNLIISGVDRTQDGAIKTVNILARDIPVDDVCVVAKVYTKKDPNENVIRSTQEEISVNSNNISISFSNKIMVTAEEYYVIYIQDKDGNNLCTPYIMPEYTSTEILVEVGGVVVNVSESSACSIGVKIGTKTKQLMEQITAKMNCIQTYVFYYSEEDAINNTNALTDTDILINNCYLKVTAEDGKTTQIYRIEANQTFSIAQLVLGYTDVALGKKVAVSKENLNLIGYSYAVEGSTNPYNVENWQGNIYFQASNVKQGNSFEFRADKINIATDGYYMGELCYKQNTNRGAFDVQLVSEDGIAYTIGSIDEKGADSMQTQKLIGNPAYVPKGDYTLRFVCTSDGTLTASELYLESVAAKDDEDSDYVTELVAEFDFDGIVSGNKYIENGIEFTVVNAKFVENPDDPENTVLALDADSDGRKTGTAYITANGGIEGDFSKGFTISIDVRPTNQSNDSNGIFGFGFLESDIIKDAGIVGDGCVYVQASTAYKVEKDDANGAKILLYPHVNNDGNSVWIEGNTVNNDKDYLKNDGRNKWNNLTYVFDNTSVSIYTNGVLSARKTADNSAFLKYLNYKNSGMLNIGCQIKNTSNKFTGYIDNVKLYSGILSNEEIKALGTKNN